MHYYQYLHDPDWVIESEEPRPDLLEWAVWSEIDAPATKFDEGGIVAPEPVVAVNDSPAAEAVIPAPVSEHEAVVDGAPVEVTEAVAPQSEPTPAPVEEVKPAPAKKAPAKKAPAKAPAPKDAE